MITGKTILGEENIVLRKAHLFIPNTKENIDFMEQDNNLSLISDEGYIVEVELCEDETEIIPSEMYDIIRFNHRFLNIPGEFLTLQAI